MARRKIDWEKVPVRVRPTGEDGAMDAIWYILSTSSKEATSMLW